MQIELIFGLNTESPIPVDHGYALYGALSQLLPEIHRENGVAIHPIRGTQVGDRKMAIQPWSQLRLRVPDDQIAPLLALAGKQIRIADSSLRIGVPSVEALIPATALRSRLMVIKVAGVTPASSVTQAQFEQAARKQLDRLNVSKEVILTIGRRRTMRLKQNEIVGYEVILEGLSAEESIAIQEYGLGGRRHMGCGVFAPLKEKRATLEK